MQIFENLENIPDEYKGAVLVIGNFDGVHRGHQVLLENGLKEARKAGKKLAVLTFEPHPHHLFYPDDPPSRLTPFALKARRLEACGVETLFSLPFDWDFASQSADNFIRSILIDGARASHVIVGHDFRFGQLRKGGPGDIKAAGLPVTIISEVSDEGNQPLSSSRVRQALRHGKIDEANMILGWDWEMSGEVVKGDQRGRELGFPTANFPVIETIHPAYGVYASLVQIEGEEIWYPSATNIGIRPMFELQSAQVETFIFDFDREIYGEILHVKPVKHLRGEAKFETLDKLITQISIDCKQAREILNNYQNKTGCIEN